MDSSGSTMDEGGPLNIPPEAHKKIQDIKEVVSDYSDADIFLALKECNMDPNETAQKLLNQDPFLEVKRRRDRKKEPQSSADSQRHSENTGQGKNLGAPSDHNVQRKNNSHNAPPGGSREFHVARDSRPNHMIDKVVNPSSQRISSNVQRISDSSEKGISAVSGLQKPYSANSSSQALNDSPYLRGRRSEAASNGINRSLAGKEKQGVSQSVTRRVQTNKPSNGHQNSATVATNSAVGVYSSSTDPVHVPSPNSRSPGAVGAFRRDVGTVGRRRSSENSIKQPSTSVSNSLKRKDVSSTNSIQPHGVISRPEQFNKTNATKTSFYGMPAGRQSSNNNLNSRPRQQPEGHQRVSQPNKEWKPKSSPKLISNPGVIETPKQPDGNFKEAKSDIEKLQDELSLLSMSDNQNVIIAQHIRVPETDRCQLTFGTIGSELDSVRHQPTFQSTGTTEKLNKEYQASLSVPAVESSDDVSGGKQVVLREGHIRISGPESSAPGTAEQQLPDHENSLSSQNLSKYADIGMVQDNSSKSHQQQDSPDTHGLTVYDPATGREYPCFRSAVDGPIRSQPSTQEFLNAYAPSNTTASTISMVQQPPVAQMYPQVQVPHYANAMPYRQYMSPVYVPPMAMPGYSSNSPYPHPPNGNNYMMMPGGGSNVNANNLKYGPQQFKHVPSGNPTGFGNFTSAAGYAMNAPGVIGSTTVEDSARIKYKANNHYAPNPQAETSEMWIQNQREIPGMQSTPTYYNMPGQSALTSYMPSPGGHATSFNAHAVAQSSNMQYPGMYQHAPQPAGMASSHHLGPAMTNNLGVGVAAAAAAASGAQAGAYHQQPQMAHLDWT